MQKQTKANIKVILGLIFAIIIAVFAVLNSTEVTVNFGFTKVMISQSIVILASVTMGAVLMYFVSVYYHYKSKRDEKRVAKENKKAEKLNDKTKDKLTEEIKTADNKLEGELHKVPDGVSVDEQNDLVDEENSFLISSDDKQK